MSDENGVLFYEHRDIGQIATNYFEGLFSMDPLENVIDVDHIRTCIYNEDNVSLLTPFSMNELKYSLFQIHSNKSPSLDGLNVALFFSKNYGIFVDQKFFLPLPID